HDLHGLERSVHQQQSAARSVVDEDASVGELQHAVDGAQFFRRNRLGRRDATDGRTEQGGRRTRRAVTLRGERRGRGDDECRSEKGARQSHWVSHRITAIISTIPAAEKETKLNGVLPPT